MEEVLTAAVRRVTGIPDATPRPGQLALARAVWMAVENPESPAVGRAPTGLGKSLSLLAPAFEAAVRYGHRTWISTESIALQEQIGHKDAPVVAAACVDVYGGDAPTYATLKGFSNYVCPVRLRQAAESSPAGTLGQVVSWAQSLEPGVDGDAGDLHSCPVVGADEAWSSVSTSPAACLGEEDCPLSSVCFALNARRRAGQADVVIGNHSLLAVQAATGSAAALGNKVIGFFDNVMVDEAHRLPSAVRSHGAVRIGAGPVVSLVNRLRAALPDSEAKTRLVNEGMRCARRVGGELDHQLSATSSPTVMIPKDTDPLSVTGHDLNVWCKTVASVCRKRADGVRPHQAVGLLSLADACTTMSAGIRSMSEPVVGTARWIEPDSESGAVVVSSPVDVSGLLATRIWSTRAPQDPEKPYVPPSEREMVKLGHVAVSGTLPRPFSVQAGIRAKIVDYPSPFDDAYDQSLLYVPELDEDEQELVFPGGTLSLSAQSEWALGQVKTMIRALGGSALVLTASTATGKAWAKALAEDADGDWPVLNQWGGSKAVVDQWRSTTDAVLVGTRSLMTGVDGAGDTCRLVVLDRVPRMAPNPLDDAITAAEAERMGLSLHQATRYSYVSDAACLMEQSAGRLIRSTSDRGVFALMDPRMSSRSPKHYDQATMKDYWSCLRRFPRHTGSLQDVTAFLSQMAPHTS